MRIIARSARLEVSIIAARRVVSVLGLRCRWEGYRGRFLQEVGDCSYQLRISERLLQNSAVRNSIGSPFSSAVTGCVNYRYKRA